MASKRKFIVDCDVGVDDAQAVMMLLSQSQPDIEVLAITAVFGNATVENTAYNSLRLLKVCDRLDIPVFKGCEKSMLGQPGIRDNFHGEDGMGDYREENPPSHDLLQKEHAAPALVRLISENPGEVTLIALGPLTNVALALHLDPQMGQKLKDCYIMGGNITARGNATVCAEFNTMRDPEAADFVLGNFGRVVTIAPLEICHQNSFEWDWYDKFSKSPGKKAEFIRTSDNVAVQWMKQDDDEKYSAFDQLAVAVAIDNKVAKAMTEAFVTVELNGAHTRGQMVVDWLKKMGKPPNARLIMEVDMELYLKHMYQAIDYSPEH